MDIPVPEPLLRRLQDYLYRADRTDALGDCNLVRTPDGDHCQVCTDLEDLDQLLNPHA